MAVEDFISLKDVKHTIEKEERQKPSLAERTKVESPGKPTPASQLESSEEKKHARSRRRRTKKSEPSLISDPIKDSILIITEKPQAAQKIALALGSPKKHIEGRVSYYELSREGKKILVASAVGHLFNLNYKSGQTGWPIFETEWLPSYEKEKAAFTKPYFVLLKKLAKKAEEIIIATDYDVEGEVIGWNVLRFIANRETAKRMKYSTLTKDALEKSYDNPLKELDWGQAYAGETRHILDWLYGINLSRALMSAIKTSGSFKILSIGRVQGPALKIIVDREKEISNFKSEPFWQVLARVGDRCFKHPKDIFDKSILDSFKDITSGLAKTKNSTESIPPSPPFDLTSLQREAYRLHKISPSKTLSTAQKLYLDGLISYPRTSSQKIPETINPKSILKSLSSKFPETSLAARNKPIEGKKSDPAHPSIYPTGEFSPLQDISKKLYDIIVKRFISVFCPDAITENKRVKITADKDPNITFISSGLKIKDPGWTKVYPATLEEKECPTLNGPVKIDEIKFREKETQPPKRYTPTSLITLLEKKNLGTKSTRSMIVDILFDRGYLDGKSIQATPLGIKLIESLEKYSPIILDENLTNQLEEEMEKIQLSPDPPEELKRKELIVLDKAKRLITDISKEFKAHEIEIGKEIQKGIIYLREEQKENNTLNQCPSCKSGFLRILYSKQYKRSFIGCSNYPNCKKTYSLPPGSLIKKSGKDCQDCSFLKLLSIKRGKRPWEFCFNPDCTSNKERIEKWKEKQNQND